MKRLLLSLALALLVAHAAVAADTKVSADTNLAALATGDEFYCVDDPGGTPLSRACTIDVIQTYVLDQGTMATSLTCTDDDWIGLGAAAGRIEWDDQATDEVNILDARVGIGTATPATDLHVENATTSAIVTVQSQTDDALLYLDSNEDGLGGERSGVFFQDNNSIKWQLYKSTTDDFVLYDNTRAANVLVIPDNGDMQLMPNGGNVGIGTATPGFPLEVSGEARITDILSLTPKATAPATCGIGDIYVDTSGAYCACSATNTWENMVATGSCV